MNQNKSEEENVQSDARKALSELPSLEDVKDSAANPLPATSSDPSPASGEDETKQDTPRGAHMASSPDSTAIELVPVGPITHVEPMVTQPVAAPSDVAPVVIDADDQEPSIGFIRSDWPASPYMNMSEQVEVTRRKGRGKVVIALVSVCVIALVGVYAFFVNHFTTHFFPHTTVNGDDVSGMSVAELSTYVTNIGQAYKTHISGQGIDLTVEGTQINFNYDGDAYGSDAASQINALSWPVEISRPHAYTVQKGISYDEEKLKEIISTTVDKFNEGAKQPTNATMVYDESAGEFTITPDAIGTALKKEEIVSLVLTGVATMQDEITLSDDLLVQPTITKDNEQLVATTKKANGLLSKPIVLRAVGNDVHTIDKNLLASWLGIGEDLNLFVNHDEIVKWAQGPLSVQVDTKGTKRSYTRPDGKKIEVEGSSYDYDYGWCLDGAALGDTLTDNLYNSNTDAIDMPMKQTAATWNPGGQEWGNRYIDVDLSEQHVRMYDDSSKVIWESDCVSGNPIYGGGTQTGVYFIYLKESPMELVGLDYDHDGQPDYRTWVTYWMPFDGGEGLHDMSTRSAFGGNIYTYNGSHGCVNLPYSAAEQLYGLTTVGDVVIVHW